MRLFFLLSLLHFMACMSFQRIAITSYICFHLAPGFLGGLEVKVSAYNAGDLGSIPVLGRSPGEGNGNSLQDCCLENPVDKRAW